MAIEIYKFGQGKYTRLCSAFSAVIIAGMGCWQLYNKLGAVTWGIGGKATLWIATMVPAGLFVVLGILFFWLVNTATVADFMIAAEGELKKVSWSNKKEIAVSTFVVIVVVVLMALLLGVTDLGFARLFIWLLD